MYSIEGQFWWFNFISANLECEDDARRGPSWRDAEVSNHYQFDCNSTQIFESINLRAPHTANSSSSSILKHYEMPRVFN